MKKLVALAVGMVFLVGVSGTVFAEGPAPTMYTLEAIYDYLLHGIESAEADHDLEPPEGAVPGDTRFKTLKQIYEGVEGQFSQAAATAANVEEGVTFWSTDSEAWGIQTGVMPAGGGVLLVTGQTWSDIDYDDGYYEKGVAFDLELGPGEDTVICNVTGLEWARHNDTEYMNWSDAIDWAEGLTLDGKSDWRLPNITEMQTLLVRDHQLADPKINQTLFPNTPTVNHWTSTTRPNDTARALHLNFGGSTFVNCGPKLTWDNYFRPVRGGE